MLLPVMFFGCKKSSSGNDIGQLLEQSGWFVHYYYDGSDKTGSYAAWTFTFTAPGLVTASSTGGTVSGNWQLSTNNKVLTLQFSGSSIINNIAGTWSITDNSGDLITMEDGARVLHFKKE